MPKSDNYDSPIGALPKELIEEIMSYAPEDARRVSALVRLLPDDLFSPTQKDELAKYAGDLSGIAHLIDARYGEEYERIWNEFDVPSEKLISDLKELLNKFARESLGQDLWREELEKLVFLLDPLPMQLRAFDQILSASPLFAEHPTLLQTVNSGYRRRALELFWRIHGRLNEFLRLIEERDLGLDVRPLAGLIGIFAALFD